MRSVHPLHGACTLPLAPQCRANVEEPGDVLLLLLPFHLSLSALFSMPNQGDRARHYRRHYAPPIARCRRYTTAQFSSLAALPSSPLPPRPVIPLAEPG